MGIYDDYLNRLAMAESGGKADAQNPNSSAGGMYQFIDSTWLQHAKPLRPDLDDASLLALKKDPTFSKQVAETFTAANDKALQSAGIDPNDKYRSLAHFAGPAGAVSLIKADPNASAASILGESAANANPFLKNMTAAQAVEWAGNRLNGKGATGEQRTETALPQKQEDTAYVNSLLQGGPLALFGKGQKGYDWGNALMNAGAALSSANSPAQAAALSSIAKNNRTNDWQMSLDPNTGVWSRYNSRTGEANSFVDQTVVDARKAYEKLKAGYKPPSDGDLKRFAETRNYLDETYGLAKDTEDLISTLDRNPGLGDWLGRAKSLTSAALDPVTGKFSPETRKALEDANLLATDEQRGFYSKVERLKSRLVLAEQIAQKGQQTEGDAIRMGKKFFDSMSNLSGNELRDALEDVRGGALKDHSRTFGTFKGYVDRYGQFHDIFNPNNAQADRFAAQAQNTTEDYKKYEALKEERRKRAADPKTTPQKDMSLLGSIFGK